MTNLAMPSEAPSISPDTLLAAVANGLLTAEQAQGLRDLESASASPLDREPHDDEKFRFISGFSDIFVTIGLGLFLGAMGYFSRDMIGNTGMFAAIAVASWLLAEYFTRRQRMALPSIVLLLVYAGAVFSTVAEAFNPSLSIGIGMGLGNHGGLPIVVAGLATAAATALHYQRFRVPVTIAAGVAALVASAVGILFMVLPDFAIQAAKPLLLACGVAVFALAMRFDLSDPQRQTRRTDIAFWLHMLAAPLIVHPLISGLVGEGGSDAISAWSILVIFIGLALVALVVDRRAILVSGLSYAGFAFGSLIVNAGLSDSVVPLTMLVLGALVLLLSAGWHALRRTLVPLLPGALAVRLPAHT
ncbi:hypothetical protein [Aminobacter niigataensis]|uniref:hypothetical protein n=1 Tax=Aminobacter niigataensis TaxID=83265 RepID=UPI0024C87DF0|nr:hypothetical protein [Aminobacter niigataensis]CAI2932096.1 conserved membrane protein of unknown function [Aminobacter niigataensis]